jgi:cyclophilin family peptidyl-prolyl cis-trans isomerase
MGCGSVAAPAWTVENIIVLRLTLLTLALSALAPLGPLGCPSNDTPADATLPDRGFIETTATAPTDASAGVTVQLVAAATALPDGGAISYAWLQTAGLGVQIANASQATASFVAPSLKTAQNLRFMVTTTDEAGDVGMAEVTIAVAADPNFGQGTTGGSRPVAEAGADQSVPGGSTVTLDGSKSTGASLRYHWRQVSGLSVTLTGVDAAQATFTAPVFDPNSSIVLLFELLVTDDADHSVTDRTQVRVRDPNGRSDQVRVSTTLGSFVMQLETEKAPISVQNFLQYVDDGFYDGTIFHRVMPDFVIQGGGFTADFVQKKTRAPIVDEASNGLSNVRGTVAMARTSDPNSATSQFFVNVANNDGSGDNNLNPNPNDKAGYAVFAKVIQGMTVVDAITAVPTGDRNNMQNVPLTNVVIQSIARVSGDAVAAGP